MMRRAALDAGMIQEESSAKLVLCLEPEAACMACEKERLAGPGAAGINVLKIHVHALQVYVLSLLRAYLWRCDSGCDGSVGEDQN
jgi:hypothetical protein